MNLQLSTPQIKTDNIHSNPFLHVEINNAIDFDLVKKLHQHYIDKEKHDWEQETWNTPEEYYGEIFWLENHDYTEWQKFYSDEWQAELFDNLKIKFPKKRYFSQSAALHKFGTQLEPHTDGPKEDSFKVAKKRWNVEITGCVTQHIYILNTDKYSHTGMCLHDNEKRFVKQINCLPGTFLAYQNSAVSYHSVPKQDIRFDRILVNLKTFW